MKNMIFKIEGGKTAEQCTGNREQFAIALFSVLPCPPGIKIALKKCN